MEIQCDNCNARLNVPEKKIPQGQRITFRCPKCNEKRVYTSNSNKKNDSPSISADQNKSVVNPSEIEPTYEDEDTSLDFYEEGVQLSLVMMDDTPDAEKVKRTVEELGYRYVSAKNTREAIGKMRFHHFELLILSDCFDGIELGQSPLLQYVNNLPMPVRRRIFVTLIGEKFKTMDHMTAFALSANLVIKRADMDRMTAVLKHAVSENEKFYKVFNDTLVEIGRA